MNETITNTNLWKQTLARRQGSDLAEEARERLRSTFAGFRNRVRMLAGDIHRIMPNYTVHDITHIDALWEMADIITAGEYALNPAEAFVFGGAVLLHDVGMSLAAYPNGLESLRNKPEWQDLVAEQFEELLNRSPTSSEITDPPEEIVRKATAHLLRELHAEQAAELVSMSWKSEPSDDPAFLIDDNEVRQMFGQTIGRVAHSHWWSVKRIESEFSRSLGAPYWCPNDWNIDVLKIACLLRVADASHLDARRAPSFLRSLRKPGPYSDDHWKFQEKLQKPYLEEDALAYTSGYSFPIEDAPSWWLSLETLQMVDKELRQTDALLADKGLPRFNARRVAGIESPERLVSYIPTRDWLPIDAVVQISDLPRVIENMGGSELYGHKPQVPLRELIQNASDAVRARRFVEDRDSDWGAVTVHLGKDDRYWLEVSDTGIGMSSDVLTDYLLDFGSTYWGSSLMRNEYPGLRASEFRAAGRYGIGFFSIFMLGEAVQIKTRRSSAAQSETMVMEFNTGLSSRPILRNARPAEQLIEGGTSVRVWMERDPNNEGGLLQRGRDNDADYSLDGLCEILCPSIDVDIIVQDQTGEQVDSEKVVAASDWTKIDGEELFRRIEPMGLPTSSKENTTRNVDAFRVRAARNLRLLTNPNGEIVGRACVAASDSYSVKEYYPPLYGVVTVGGLKACPLTHLAGVFIGEVVRVSRDAAKPLVHPNTLSKWATEQANLIPNLYRSPAMKAFCAQVIRMCGGETGELPICKRRDEWATYQDIADTEWGDEVLLLNSFFVRMANEHNQEIDINDNVIIGDFGMTPGILQAGSYTLGRHSEAWPIAKDKTWWTQTISGAVVRAIAESWSMEAESLYESVSAKDRVSRVVGFENGEEVEADVVVVKNLA